MEKPGLIKTASKNHIAIVILLVWMLGLALAAQAGGKKKDSSNENIKLDYAAVHQEIIKFEAAINDVINSAFSSNPFAVVQKAKGAYLEDYGISLSFCINIHRAIISTPFGQFRSQDTTSDLKKRRIEELKEKLIGALQENGDIFRQLQKENYVTIVAFFEDRNIPDEPNANKTIVLSALKKDLDEFGHKIDRLQQFKQRMKIIEY
jgi:hypothetical protein